MTNSVMEFSPSPILCDQGGVIDFRNNIIRNITSTALLYSGTGTFEATLMGNTFEDNSGYAVDLSQSGAANLNGTNIIGNTAKNNGVNGIKLTGSFYGNTILGSAGIPYILEEDNDRIGSVHIAPGATMSILAGAVLKSPAGSYWYEKGTGFEVEGTLNVLGTEQRPVVFTSIRDDSYGGDTNKDGAATSPAPGDWTRILIRPGGTASIDHALIRYSGGGVYGQSSESIRSEGGSLTLTNSFVEQGADVAIRSLANGLLHIEGSQINTHAASGLVGDFSGVSAPVIRNNSFNSNQGYASIFNLTGDTQLDGSQISGNTALANNYNGISIAGTLLDGSVLRNAGIPYILREDNDRIGSITVPAGNTLTIQSGTIFKILGSSFWYEKGTGFEVLGTLTAVGTETQPVVFTSIKDDLYGGDTNNDGTASSPAAGDWTRILIGPGGVADLNYVVDRFSGGGVNGQTSESIRNDGGTLILQNSTLQNGNEVGIRNLGNGSVTIHNSALLALGQYGLLYSGTTPIKPTITNSAFNGHTSYPIGFDLTAGNSLDTTLMSGNVANGNGKNGVRLWGSVAADSTLSNIGFPFVISGGLTVQSAKTLSLLPNVIVKFTANQGIQVDGTLTASGSAAEPVIFTSIKDDLYGGDTNNDQSASSPVRSDWNSIVVASGGVLNMTNAQIRYAGWQWCGVNCYGDLSAIHVYSGGSVVLDYVTILEHGGYGILMEPTATSSLSIANSSINLGDLNGIYVNGFGNSALSVTNTAVNNHTASPIRLNFSNGSFGALSGLTGASNTLNGIQISGTLGADTSFTANPDFPYIVDGGLTIYTGKLLHMAEGVVVKFAPNNTIQVNGTLEASGSAASPVIFTSLKDDTVAGDTNNDGAGSNPARGDWNGVLVSDGNSLHLSHAELRFAGWMWCGINCYGNYTTIELNGAATATLEDVTITESGGYGIQILNAAPSSMLDLTRVTITNNNAAGIQIPNSGTFSLTISDSLFSGNPIGIFNGNSSTTMAITDSDFLQNGTGILVSLINTGNISNCIFEQNTSYAINNTSGSTINAENNWWNSASGPIHASNPTGTGDAVNGLVDFVPWLTVRPR